VLTPREVAQSVYTACRSMGRTRPMGDRDDEMAVITGERNRLLDLAILRVERAIASERRFACEPSDEQLSQMLQWLKARRGDSPEVPKTGSGLTPT